MKILVIEILISCALFALFAIPATVKHPKTAISDYPPAIRQRCKELGIIEDVPARFTTRDYIRKGLAMVFFAAVFAWILAKVNHIHTFKEGFFTSYLIWLAIAWFDAFVVDIGWFCHSKQVIIPGTEDMKEYKDYMFHIIQSGIGSLLGLPVCLLVGWLVTLF